jgi:hypothetical protein
MNEKLIERKLYKESKKARRPAAKVCLPFFYWIA